VSRHKTQTLTKEDREGVVVVEVAVVHCVCEDGNETSLDASPMTNYDNFA
jgi:hypothetical protein